MRLDHKLVLIFLGAIGLSFLMAPPSQAGFIEQSVPGAAQGQLGVDTLLNFHRRLEWGFAAGAETWPTQNAQPNPAETNWLATLSATAQDANGRKDLTLNWQHLKVKNPNNPKDPHRFDDEPNPPNPFTKTLPNLSRPPAGITLRTAEMFQVTNGAVPHFDLFTYKLARNPPGTVPPAEVEMFGDHKEKALTEWSYRNRGDKARTIDVIASYPAGLLPVRVAEDVKVAPGERKHGELPKRDNQLPTDLRFLIRGSGTSDTTLFFPGEADGVPQELDLSLAAQFFVGFGEFLAPALFNETIDLRVSVNMVEWLSFRPEVLSTSPIPIDQGTSDDLPGFTVFNALDNTPFTGLVDIAGFLDGEVIAPAVPAPSALALLVAGLLGLLGNSLATKQRARRGSPQTRISIL